MPDLALKGGHALPKPSPIAHPSLAGGFLEDLVSSTNRTICAVPVQLPSKPSYTSAWCFGSVECLKDKIDSMQTQSLWAVIGLLCHESIWKPSSKVSTSWRNFLQWNFVCSYRQLWKIWLQRAAKAQDESRLNQLYSVKFLRPSQSWEDHGSTCMPHALS